MILFSRIEHITGENENIEKLVILYSHLIEKLPELYPKEK